MKIYAMEKGYKNNKQVWYVLVKLKNRMNWIPYKQYFNYIKGV